MENSKEFNESCLIMLTDGEVLKVYNDKSMLNMFTLWNMNMLQKKKSSHFSSSLSPSHLFSTPSLSFVITVSILQGECQRAYLRLCAHALVINTDICFCDIADHCWTFSQHWNCLKCSIASFTIWAETVSVPAGHTVEILCMDSVWSVTVFWLHSQSCLKS